jgi:hypothetical protein
LSFQLQKKRAERINQVMQNKASGECDINWLSEIQGNDVITGALLIECGVCMYTYPLTMKN